MPNPLSTTDAPALTDKKVRKVYIKDGKRRVSTDGGFMFTSAHLSRRMFGKLKGGRYSHLQES